MSARRWISLLLCTVLLFSCIGTTAAKEGPAVSSMMLADCDGLRLGILTGSIHDTYAKQYFPHAELLYFSTISDMVTALMADNIDAFSNDILTVQSLLAENDQLAYIDEPLDYLPTAYVFPKDAEGAALRDKMNAFLTKLTVDGTLEALQDKWLSYGAGDYAVDMSGLDPNAETLTFATSCAGKPCSYFYNGAPTGYEVELAVLFCEEYSYNLDIAITDFAGIIPGMVSGKYDFGGDAIGVTEERSQSVNFSDPDYRSAVVMTVRKEEASASGKSYSAIEQFNTPDTRLGIVTGMSFEPIYEESAPLAELKYFNTLPDVVNALSIGQIDGFLLDTPMAHYLASNTEGLTYLEENVGDIYEYACMFGKTETGEALCAQFNEYLAKIKADGTYDAMETLWYGPDSDEQVVNFPADGPNGVISLATNSESPPGAYIKDGKLVGLEMDMLARFCTEYGYGLEINDMSFSAVLAGISSGRYDMAAALICITEERKESVLFSDPYMETGALMMIREPVQKVGFWQKLSDSFDKTFLRENRWKLIVDGIKTTMIISVCACILGTALGFGLCMLRRMKNRLIFGITTVYIRILQGTPLLVLLMILFYVVFAKTGLSGEIVAIIAFAMNFAAYVCEIIRSGIDAIDVGQIEAALAIGFTKSQTFFRIVMPQATMRFLPVYKGEFISLVKMTSIVGYIAVQDLTKMSDIIRSRTYEAFFPLIATAVIYFILSAALTALLKAVEIKIEPKRDNRRVKGVSAP